MRKTRADTDARDVHDALGLADTRMIVRRARACLESEDAILELFRRLAADKKRMRESTKAV